MASGRIASIDIFRAITMFLMLFANDFAGMAGIPHWLGHAKTTEDMMGFSDLIFPSFLFCVGMSIPFAIKSRIKKGENSLQVIWHILLRSLALIVMGLLSMNSSSLEGGLSHQVQLLIMVLGYFLVWNDYPSRKTRYIIYRIIGIVLLVLLVAYRISNGAPIRPKWWGILGLIGWAYLVISIPYFLFGRKNFVTVAIIWLLSIGLMIATAAGVTALKFYPGGWTHPALVASGLFISSAAIYYKSGKFGSKATGRFVGFSILLAILGAVCFLMCHQFWIISKNQATPTWFFGCLVVDVIAYLVIYLICDVIKFTIWARPISAGGTATLTCFMLPSVTYSIRQIFGIHYPEALCTGTPGLIKAAVFALIIILLAELLGKFKIKLKI